MKLYFSLVWLSIRSHLEYPTSLVLDVLSSTMLYLADFIVVYFFAQKVGGINGWNATEIIILQLFVVVASSLDSFLSYGLRFFARNELLSGNFDLKLLKPVNPLVILMGRINVGGLAIIPFVLFVLPILYYLEPSFFTLSNFFWSILSIIGGTMIFTSLKIISSSIGFWTFDSESFYRITKIGTRPVMWYPNSIYPKYVRVFLMTILPLSFVSHMPAHIVIRKEGYGFLPYLSLVVGITCMLISLLIWKISVNKYESSGA